MVTVTVLTIPTAPETGMTVNCAEVGADGLWVVAGAALCWGAEAAGVCCGEVLGLESAADTEDTGENVTDGAKLMDDKAVGAAEAVAIVVTWLVVASGERGIDVAAAGLALALDASEASLLAPPWFVVGSKVV